MRFHDYVRMIGNEQDIPIRAYWIGNKRYVPIQPRTGGSVSKTTQTGSKLTWKPFMYWFNTEYAIADIEQTEQVKK